MRKVTRQLILVEPRHSLLCETKMLVFSPRVLEDLALEVRVAVHCVGHRRASDVQEGERDEVLGQLTWILGFVKKRTTTRKNAIASSATHLKQNIVR